MRNSRECMALAATGNWVVLPTYNERENLASLVRRLLDLGLGLNILVVDDDSPDGTGEIASALAKSEENVHLLRRTGKRGLGAAYLAGFEFALKAGAEVVVSMDCDFSHQPEALPEMIAGLNGSGCVVGSRYAPGGRIENWPLRRKLLSATANRFVRILFGMPIADCTSGYRVYRRSVVEDIIRESPRSQGYSFLVEVLQAAAKGPLPIVEYPICFVERKLGMSKMGTHEIIGGARSLISLRLKQIFTPRTSGAEQMAVEIPDRRT